MKTIKREIASAFIIASDNKVLLGRKKPGGVYPNCWHGPGGGIENNETKEQALSREVREEVGIDITTAAVGLVDDTIQGESVKTLPAGEQVLVKMRFNIFKANINKRSSQILITESDDLIDLQWFTISEFKDLNLTPPAKELVAKFGYEWLTTTQKAKHD